jgi:uncharacterized protein (DUF362 family)
MNRRTFIKNTLVGGTSLCLGAAATRADTEARLPEPPPIHLYSLPGYNPSPLGVPGLFPGRVIEVHDANAIHDNHVSQPVVRRMIEQGMKELTGETSLEAAWARFVTPKDIVGIKINPAGAPACCSSPEIVSEIVRGLRSAGVRDIFIYDRFSQFIQAGGYHTLLPPGIGVVGIEDRTFDISSYDMSVYCEADFFGEFETRSYMAKVVAETITKIVNVPVLKDHCAAGVTGCLKNLAYGSFSNVDRSHQPPISFTDPLIGLLCSIEPLRSKAVLHILDGMREVWHGGPLTQVQEFIAQPGLILFGTDPVAVDTIELGIISKKRELEGALLLWDRNPANLTADVQEFYHNPHQNLYYRRPDHIEAAGRLGLGVWETGKINHSKIAMG